MTREKTTFRFQIDPLSLNGSLEGWLQAQAVEPSWLLAHAIDGVIWGWVGDSELRTSHEVAPISSPPLRVETLQQMRLFNPKYEVRLWRDGPDWHAIRISDTEHPAAASVDEQQLLWGTHAEQLAGGFIRLEDGAQGLVHIVPPFAGSETVEGRLGMPTDESLSRIYLAVRHYLTEDALGVNSITLSRLVHLGVQTYAPSTK